MTMTKARRAAPSTSGTVGADPRLLLQTPAAFNPLSLLAPVVAAQIGR
ncbi:MAG: hypothetical protein R3E79_25145 [Caldilineaceae bacterium]